jgi:hypothetical protein
MGASPWLVLLWSLADALLLAYDIVLIARRMVAGAAPAD